VALGPKAVPRARRLVKHAAAIQAPPDMLELDWVKAGGCGDRGLPIRWRAMNTGG
jgi:hypothetical protein